MVVRVVRPQIAPRMNRALSPAEFDYSALPISKRTKGVLFDTYVYNPSIDESILFESIAAPTLISHAADDPAPSIEGARLIPRRISHCELVAYEAGGHIILRHYDEVETAIRQFVQAR